MKIVQLQIPGGITEQQKLNIVALAESIKRDDEDYTIHTVPIGEEMQQLTRSSLLATAAFIRGSVSYGI